MNLLKNRKGFIQFLTLPVIIALIIGIVILFIAAGLLVYYLTKVYYVLIGVFLLVIAGIMALKFDKINKDNRDIFKVIMLLIVIFGILLLFVPKLIESMSAITLSVIG